MLRALTLGSIFLVAPLASGQMVITEWMYSGTDGEFIEFTNVGSGSVDMSGWSFDDSSQIPGTVDLSAFGIVEPGESVILTEALAADFSAAWNLNGVDVIGELSANLGRNDQINLYNAAGVLVDQLSYGDEDYPGTPRTQAVSCNIPESDYAEAVAQTDWVLATVGDAFGSHASSGGDIASPGRIVGYALSDFDQDGDVDLADFEAFVCCMTGPDVSYDPPPGDCGLSPDAEGYLPADADRDFDVDLYDLMALQSCFSGEDVPADPTCGHDWTPPGTTIITLNGDLITVDGPGVTIDGTIATITTAGSYRITGTLDDGQIAVDSAAAGTVEMILSGVDISSSTSAAINVINAAFTSVVLADQTENYLVDADEYIYDDPDQDEPNACLFSDDSMSISGTGALTVYGNYNDAIASKDELIITGGTITVVSVDDGIRGKDYLLIENGDITLTTEGDALKSDNADDPELGYITINNGTVDIVSSGDGIAAETAVSIAGGDFTILSGGGHAATLPPDVSAKGIKGLASVTIDGGDFDLDCADDGVHSNDTIIINSGTIDIASGDDAVHADLRVDIDGGTITITACYEGIESTDISVTDGDIYIVSDEDAITADATVSIIGGEFDLTSGGGHDAYLPPDFSAKGIKGLASVAIDGGTFVLDCADDGVHSNDTITIGAGTLTIATGDDGVHADLYVEINGGTITVTDSYEGIEAADITINDGNIHVTSSDDGINGAGGDGSGDPPPPGDHLIRINGGYIVVDAAGDGIDVNGDMEMTGGTVLVHGPTMDFNSALDYDGTFTISGGFLVAVGSSRMAQAPGSSSTQRSVKVTYSQWKTANTLIHIETSAGDEVLTFAPAKSYKSCVFSSPDLQAGVTYHLYRGGSSTGTALDGLFQGGVYTPGTQTNTFTANNIVTNVYAP